MLKSMGFQVPKWQKSPGEVQAGKEAALPAASSPARCPLPAGCWFRSFICVIRWENTKLQPQLCGHAEKTRIREADNETLGDGRQGTGREQPTPRSPCLAKQRAAGALPLLLPGWDVELWSCRSVLPAPLLLPLLPRLIWAQAGRGVMQSALPRPPKRSCASAPRPQPISCA